MILIIILLILIGLTSYEMFKAYYNNNTSNDFLAFTIGTLFFIILLFRCIAIELQLITIT